MKKRLLTLTIISCILLTGCGHEHTFSEATCTEPKTCTECGETEGEALGHVWIDATCTEPKTCSVCGATEGEPLEHKWLDATYDAPKTCELCGLTEGEPLEKVDAIETTYINSEEPEIITEEPETDEVTPDEESNYQVDNVDITADPIQKRKDDWKARYEKGEISKEDYELGLKLMDELFNVGNTGTSEYGHIDVEVPGFTPYDPSQDGQYVLGQGGELPDDLKGAVVH